MHGQNGEDGTIQGLYRDGRHTRGRLRHALQRLCMDKDRAHKLVELAGVDVPAAIVLTGMPDEEALRSPRCGSWATPYL